MALFVNYFLVKQRHPTHRVPSFQHLVYCPLKWIEAREADVLEGLLALGIIDGIGGDALRLILVEDVVVLLFREVVVVAIDVLDHLLPGGEG